MRRRNAGRRRALLTLGGLGAVLATQPARAASDAPAEILQPAQPTPDAFMRRAFDGGAPRLPQSIGGRRS